MKTLTKIMMLAALCCGLTFVVSSCEQKEEFEEPAQEVVFSASTSYNNLPETKTVYSGQDFNVSGNSGTERIDWVENDAVRILNANTNAAATYNVVSSTINNSTTEPKSTTEITAASDKLTWGTESTNTFYAVYPSTAMNSSNQIGANIPATQPATVNMNLAYMVAKAENQTKGSEVTLPFTPAMTAFEFRVALADGASSVTISQFKMTTTGANALTGNWTWDGSNFNTVAKVTGSNDNITVTFPSGTSVGTRSAPLKFTVFALPQELSNLTLEFTLSNGTKTLVLNNNFTACKKYRITTPNIDTYEYILEEIPNLTAYGHFATTSSMPFNVTSYKIKNGNTSNKIPVEWEIEYSANGSTGWTTSDDGKLNVNILTGGGGSTLTVNNGANVMRDHTTGEYTGDNPDITDGATAALRSADPIPDVALDSDDYYDLSKHPVYGAGQYGDPENNIVETANCYVVQRPGLYKFPLVYGNALRNGTNAKSYAPTISTVNGQFLTPFVRHDGSGITGPWIKDNVDVSDVIIVWQDGTNNEAGRIIRDNKVSIDGNYVKFEVERELIRPGNVIIAAVDGNTIVWSWHIWVTEKNLTPESVKDATNVTLSMMPYNLGWMDATGATNTAYETWTIYCRVKQKEEGGTSRIFRIRQIGDVVHVDANVGCNTFYQWGRKDPMLPATGENKDKAQYSAHNLEWESSKTHAATGGIEESIQHPNWQLVDLSGSGYTGSESHYKAQNNDKFIGNLWDAELDNGNGNFNTFGQRQAVKTVYDPCPPGFVVPYVNAFTGFGKNDTNIWNYFYVEPRPAWNQPGTVNGTVHANGWNFENNISGTVFFPYCGARAHNGNSTDSTNGSIYDVNNCGYYWTSCPMKFNDTGGASGIQYRQAAKMLIMYPNYIRPAHEQRKGAAYAIRPVVQTAF